MDANTLKAEIRLTFEALTEQMEIIGQNQGRIPQIEIDLIMDNIRELYSAFKDLDRLNNPYQSRQDTTPPPVAEQKKPEESPVREFAFRDKISLGNILTRQEEKEPEAEPEVFKPAVAERVYQQEQPVAPEPAPVYIPEPITMPQPAPVIIPEPTPVPEPAPVYIPEPIPAAAPAPPPQPAPAPDPAPISEITLRPPKPSGDLFSAPSSHSISDSYKDEKKTLNDRLQADSTDRSIGSRLSQNQISDIKTAIGINEKFQFINELFAGNMQEYTMGMSQLNQFRNFAEAANFIDILKFKYNWDMNADAYRKLMEILRRRYPA